MITVTLFKNDEEWTCYFDYTVDAEKWIEEEETRPYWNEYTNITITGEDRVETPFTPL